MAKSALSNSQYQQITSVTSTQGQWINYVPDFQGFGTVTNINIKYRQNGPNLDVEGFFTATNPTAVEGRMSFPAIGIISSSSLPAISIAGQIAWDDSSNPATYIHVLREPSVSYFTFGGKQTTQNQLNKTQPNGYWASGTRNIALRASVPIEGWQSSQTKVMDIADPYENTYSARINPGASSIISSSSDFILSVVDGGAGITTVNFKPGFFTVTPSIVASTDHSNYFASPTSPTASSVIVYTRNDSGALADVNFTINVQRQGVDYKEPRGYFITNGSITRWQKKTLPSQITSNGVISALGFNNLEVGKTYRLITQIHHLCVNNITSRLAYTNGSSTVLVSEMDPEGVGGVRRTSGGSAIFTAMATTLTATATVSGGAAIENGDTWAILEEVPWHEQTIKWT